MWELIKTVGGKNFPLVNECVTFRFFLFSNSLDSGSFHRTKTEN